MTAVLWDAAGLRAATGGTLRAACDVTRLCIDSRAAGPGDLFVALRGERDGHDFVADALLRGAVAAVVQREPKGVAPDAPLLRVGDTQAALTALGAAGRARFRGRVAAITGSVGKTGTKDMLRLALGALAATHAAEKSYNNHLGVPLTLAEVPPDAAYAVIEIGMNNPGEIAPLSRLAAPHVVAVTAVDEAHVGHLGSLAAIAAEKASIVAGAVADGVAVLPRDSPCYSTLADAARARRLRILAFGRDGEARLLDATADADGTRAHLTVGGTSIEVTLPVIGLHHAHNALCALAVVAALGGDCARAAAALAQYAPAAGRGGARTIRVDGGTALLIDESYNAAPAAMRAALEALALRPAARRVAVLGAMRELGVRSEALHAALAPHAIDGADRVFCCGADMRALWDALPAERRGAYAEDSVALAPLVVAALRPGDVVLVKGALGTRMAAVVGALDAAA